ncbi:hypothetical protein JEU11_01885 [Paraglaciecola chathamensis]|mgnify:CR=1 FL=1|uniref:Uncharacterized protein n=1 Tax=Paraglaciecola chathamensis TaxID=368405 RepID=A0ABS0W8V0_9ALTE|nr:hypothetical protein [Paraglaciecola chathamensis]MBJ2135196.1 hypothetical protein [Paraglaciecola chathamensis]
MKRNAKAVHVALFLIFSQYARSKTAIITSQFNAIAIGYLPRWMHS